MNRSTYISSSLICILISILTAVLFSVPHSMVHEYYILAAKHWSDGMIPWLGFNLLEMPLGISVLSHIPSIELNQNIALLFVLVFHLINAALLYSFMQKLDIEPKFSQFGIIIYLCMLIGLCDFGITLEPFAVFFIILSLFGIISHKRVKNLIAAVLLVFATMIKIQVVLLVPILALIIFLPTHRHHVHSTRTFLFLLIFSFSFLLCYIGITSWSENAEWIAEIHWGLMNKTCVDWLLLLCNSGILLLMINKFRANGLKGLGKNLNRCAWFGSIIFILCTIIAGDIANIQLVLPINIIAITYHLYKIGDKIKTCKIYYLCAAFALFASTLNAFERFVILQKENPLIETFDVNYQLQQEIKNPVQGDINIVTED